MATREYTIRTNRNGSAKATALINCLSPRLVLRANIAAMAHKRLTPANVTANKTTPILTVTWSSISVALSALVAPTMQRIRPTVGGIWMALRPKCEKIAFQGCSSIE